jgi:hypothetical protein
MIWAGSLPDPDRVAPFWTWSARTAVNAIERNEAIASVRTAQEYAIGERDVPKLLVGRWAHAVGALQVHPHKHYANYPPQEDRGCARGAQLDVDRRCQQNLAAPGALP